MAEAELELRILTGIHAGARARAEQQFVIGADADCDIVLSDGSVAARHAEIKLAGDRWTVIPLRPIEGAPPAGIELSCGARISIGRVLISIDAANAPWQEVSAEEALHAAQRDAPDEEDEEDAQASDPPDVPTDAQTDSDMLDIEDLPMVADPTLRSIDPAATRSGTRWQRGVSIAAGVAVLVAVAIAGTLISQPAPDPASAPVASPDKSDAIAVETRADVTRVKAILEERKNPSLRMTIQGNGTVLVSGFARDDDEYLAIADALSRIQPRPTMRVHIETEIRNQAKSWTEENRKEGWGLTYLGDGSFALAGIAKDEAQRDEMMQTVREEFTMLAGLADQVRLYPQFSQELEDKLRQGGFAAMNLKWVDDQMELNVAQVTPTQLTRLEELLIHLYTETKGRLRFRARATLTDPPQSVRRAAAANGPDSGAAAVSAAVADNSLPFEIRSITGGVAPYILLKDGRRVMIGGAVGDLVLSRIDAGEIVFEGARRVVVKR